jgi:hypothetical protein
LQNPCQKPKKSFLFNKINSLRVKLLQVKLYHKVPKFVPLDVQFLDVRREKFNEFEGLGLGTMDCTEVSKFVPDLGDGVSHWKGQAGRLGMFDGVSPTPTPTQFL